MSVRPIASATFIGWCQRALRRLRRLRQPPCKEEGQALNGLPNGVGNDCVRRVGDDRGLGERRFSTLGHDGTSAQRHRDVLPYRVEEVRDERKLQALLARRKDGGTTEQHCDRVDVGEHDPTPGPRTLAISAIAGVISATWVSANEQVMTSTDASATGSDSRLPKRKVARETLLRATSSIASVASTPMTS